MHIGVIGLGIIGSRMARNWQKAGHQVIGWNRTRKHAEGLGIPLAATPAELAAKANVVMIVVADPPALESVVSGADGIARTSLKGKTVLNASTVGARDNRQTEKAVRAAGGEFLETPFTGSKGGAEAAKLVFYVGGDTALLRRIEPLLLQIGTKIFHFGAVGTAADAKLIMNLMLANLMQAMAEGFVLAQKTGLDMSTFVAAYKANAGWSILGDMKVPKMLERDFAAHFALKHMDKDLRLALERAAEVKADLPQAKRLKEIFSEAMAAGMGDDDFSTVYRLVAEKTGFDR
jgi:glyoxylate/succinic semialdehyde reductase